MKLNKMIWASIAGTTAMTLFSYFISQKKRKNFKEPELLGKLIHRAIPSADKENMQATGWVVHYTAGAVFAAIYYQLLKYTDVKPTVGNGLLVGALSGLPAIAIWYTVLTLHPNPPHTSNRYYGHLVAAHVVFGAFTFLAYQASKRDAKLEK
jgi:hypothetical protein